ncbi:MAG TPA: GWxTD domain-containing protein [Candidatus Polarisedimenticolia bacterium]|nr:GWxTD domain-containing protein [Candidatus Polarisedimenticolia bacterium]
MGRLQSNEFRRNAVAMNSPLSPRFFFRRTIVLFAAMLFAFSGIAFGQKKQKLEKNFRDWLERDVAYIITKDERDSFLKLTNDEDREKFIETFWEIRNPSAGSPTNTYKDEIYQRIAFADARFGIGSGVEGWRTDRGRTYITLGPPQQKQVYRNSANLYPMEIWFYSGANPALPPFFYVMFYQREGSGDYRFYSPYTDGPDKLATGVEAINSRSAALRMIRDSAGPEVARISLSLLPDEPVDETTGIVSLQSDILLNSIKNLANLPANRDDILRRRANREAVTSRLVLEGHNLDIVTFPARDSRGLTRLDYALRLHSPNDLSMAEERDGRYSYSVEIRVRVLSAENKLIFTQQKTLADSITKKRLDSIKDRVFGYEGTLPLPPGKYHIEFQFTDWSKKAAFYTVREISIPVPSKDSLVVPAVMPFLSAENADPGLADLMPFTIGGVQFTPMPSSTPTLALGTNLQVVYQIWSAPSDPRENLGKKIDVEYAFGRPAAPGSATRVKDEINREQFDAAGSLVTGKKLSLDQQSSGNYILNVSVNNPETKHSGFGTMNFKVLDAPPQPEPWDVLEPGIVQDAERGILDQQRGLSYWALGQYDEARVWFRRALQVDHSNDVARARLVDAYFSKKDYAAVVSLFSDAGVTETTDSETLLRIATCLQKLGDTSKAISVLESVLPSRSEEGPLYLALAQYYSEVGNPKKAADLSQRGKSLLAESPVKP